MKKLCILALFFVFLLSHPILVQAPQTSKKASNWIFELKADPRLYQIALCESGLNPKAFDIDGGAYARGLFQITRKYWPEISDEQAFDPEWSLSWAKKQKLTIWTCYKS